jgi:hypothetical protein
VPVSGKTPAPSEIPYLLGTDIPDMGAGDKAIAERVAAILEAENRQPLSWLKKGTKKQIIVCNSSGVPQYQSMSGDVTIDEEGITAIGNNKLATGMYQDGSVTEVKQAGGATGLAKGAFSAWRTTAFNLSGEWQAVPFNSEEFDVSGWYDTANGRFTPQVAGIYRLSCRIGQATGSAEVALMKGSVLDGEPPGWKHLGEAGYRFHSFLVGANGTTDFFRIMVQGSGSLVVANEPLSYFQGELVGRT